MSNYIFLHGLQLKTKIGVPDLERENFQVLHIDIDIKLDSNLTFNEDDIDQTIDYAEIEKLILNIGNNHQYRLLESLGEEIIATIKSRFLIEGIELKIAKNTILPHTDFVGIVFKR